MFFFKMELTKLSVFKCSVRFGWGLVCHMVSITQPERERSRSRELRLFLAALFTDGTLCNHWHHWACDHSSWLAAPPKILCKHMSIQQTSFAEISWLGCQNRQVNLSNWFKDLKDYILQALYWIVAKKLNILDYTY